MSQSGNSYKEAVECLCKLYDRPGIVHQAHVHALFNVPIPREGNNRDWWFHDVAMQHVRALEGKKQDSFESFLVSALELRLDKTTTHEWQWYSKECKGLPSYTELLEFVDR